MPTNQKPWTKAELKKAQALWMDAKTYEDIAAALGRTGNSVKHVIAGDRDRFPRRNRPHGSSGRAGSFSLKLNISHFMHKTIKKAARERRVTMNVMIHEALRLYFLKSDSSALPQPEHRNLPQAKVKWVDPAEIVKADPADVLVDILSPSQRRFYTLLEANVGKFVPIRICMNHIWGHDPDGGPTTAKQTMGVMALRIRQRLGLTRFELYSRAEQGYILTKLPDMKEILRDKNLRMKCSVTPSPRPWRASKK